MAKQNQNTRQMLIAWLLLALFMLPMVVKSVHVCQVETELANGHHAIGQQGQSHNPDSCSICHFAFFNFVKGADVLLATATPILLGFLFLFTHISYVRPEVEVTSLRAPPVRF